MTKLSKTQIDLLTAAADDAGTPVDPDQRPTVNALVRKGFLIIIPQPDGERAMITQAGRACLGPESEPGAADHRSPPTVEAPDAHAIEEPAAKAPREPGGKIAALLELLRRPAGARVEEMVSATGWQQHSVRGAIAGSIKKKLGVAVVSEKIDGARIYRAEGGAA